MKTTIDALVEALASLIADHGGTIAAGSDNPLAVQARAALSQARAEKAEREEWTRSVMQQAQVFASAWAIAGSRFDSGDGMQVAEQEKETLRAMLSAAPVAKLEPLAPDELRKDNTLMSSNATMSLSLDQLSELADAVTAIHNLKLKEPK